MRSGTERKYRNLKRKYKSIAYAQRQYKKFNIPSIKHTHNPNFVKLNRDSKDQLPDVPPRFFVSPYTNSSTSLCNLPNSKLNSESCRSEILGFSWSGADALLGDSGLSRPRRVGKSVLRREVGEEGGTSCFRPRGGGGGGGACTERRLFATTGADEVV